jgi:hypothetical protein
MTQHDPATVEMVARKPRLASVTIKHGVAFSDWCASLDRWAGRYGYGANFVQQTGEECWREYYHEGYSPSEALREDNRHGI